MSALNCGMMTKSPWYIDMASNLLEFKLPRRWRHVRGVLSRVDVISPVFDQGNVELLYAAAALHDIGYSPDLVDTGFHSLDGARFLEGCNVSTRLCALVAHHSYACCEASLRGLDFDLKKWKDERTPLRDALWWADMTTGPAGDTVSVHERIAEIQERYGPEDLVTVFIRQAEPELVAAVERTEARLRDAGVEIR